MRLGISSPLRHDSPEQWARQQKELGCGAVVFPVDCTAPDLLVDEYVKAARKYGLQIAEVGIWRNAISPNEAQRNAAVEYSIGQLKLADRVHAKCCVNVAGSAGECWDGAYRENFSRKTWDASVRMIQEIIDEAAPKNTWFTIEPMPWMLPTGPEEYVKLLEDVDRERFAVHMDIINMINCPERYFFAGEFVKRCFDLLGSRIRSCHLKDILLGQEFTFQLKECACGEGVFCLETYARMAHACDPDMPMIIEHLQDDSEYVKSMEYVKKRFHGLEIRN